MSGFSQSRFAAALQEMVAKRREESGLYQEIADQLPLGEAGRLLDVGTGTGLQLKVIHEGHPAVELYGLDLSPAAIQVAHRHLQALPVDLRVGSIASTPYDDDFFDIVTCNSSMSYWDDPGACFDEIFRILKSGGSAVLFEPQKEIDYDQVVRVIRANLADKSPLRRFAAVTLNKYGLRYGRAVGLKLRSLDKLAAIAHDSRFGLHVSIERTILQNLPIFVRVILRRPVEGS